MSTDYDIITVGGGLGGSALAKVLAERGARVLVVERESQFKDRVSGEWMAPWGDPIRDLRLPSRRPGEESSRHLGVARHADTRVGLQCFTK